MADLARLLFVVPFGYVAALVAAAATVALSVAQGFFLTPFETAFVAGWATLYAGAWSFVPALVAVVVAEAFRIRSVFFFLLFGGGLGFVVHLLTPVASYDGLADSRAVAFAAAGFVAGLTYWLIAGRLSGIGRGRETARP